MKTPFDASPFFISVTAYYALSLPEYHMPMHTHDSCEIMYVTSGGCQVYSEDGVHALTANQFIFLSANTPHRLEISAGRSCAILNLEFNCLGRKQTELPLRELLERCPGFATWLEAGHTCLIAEDQRNLGYAMKDLITQLPLAQDDGPELMRLLFSRMILEFLFCTKHSRRAQGAAYLKKACSYIEQNLLETLTVPLIAAHTGINKSYLQLLFSRQMGCSVVGYITQKRLEQAAFLLTNSSMKITDIAFACGYNSRQHFAHSFEKYYKAGPSAYRKLHARTLIPDTEDSRFLLDENGHAEKQKMY